MVIVKNPKTGKYEVKPSPKSFYEAKKPSRSANGSRSSSGGGLTKEEIARAEKPSNVSMSEQLRELERINKQLGIKPEQLARSASRRVSEEARRFVETETRMKVQPETQRLNGTQQQLQKQLESKRLAASQQLSKIIGARQQQITEKKIKQIAPKYYERLPEIERQRELKRLQEKEAKLTGEVQISKKTKLEKLKDIPAKAIEKVTGKKPREVFRFITGAEEKDITKPLTIKEVGYEATQVPVRGLSIASTISGRVAGLGFEKATGKEEVTLGIIPEKEITYYEPQFGTVTPESKAGMIKKTAIGEAKSVKITTKQVEEVTGGVVSLVGTAVAPMLFAPGFVVGGTKKALNKELPVKERIYGGVEAALGGAIIGGKVVRYLKAPIIETKPVRAIKKPQAFEVQKQITVAEKPTTASLFEIRGEISPPTITTKTTRVRKAVDWIGLKAEKAVQVGKEKVVSFGFKPKVIKRTPAKEFVIRTPEPVIGEQPFIVAETRTGRKFATISRITGKTKKISLEQFEKLSKQEQLILQKRAIEITGRQVPLKQVPKILSKEVDRTTSLIRAEPQLRIKPGKRVAETKLVPGKRRPSLSLGVSEAKKIKEIPSGEIIKARTLLKDITFERRPQAGKITELETTILRLKAKPKPGEEVGFISPAKIKKTPISKTFQKVKVEPAAAKVQLPKPALIKPTKTILEKPTTKLEKVGVTGLAIKKKPESVYTGTGQYELSEQVSVKMDMETTKPEVLSISSLSTTQIQKPVTTILQKPITISGGIQKPKEVQKIKEVQKQAQIIKQIQKPETILKLRSTQIQKPREIQKPIKPRIPKIPTPTSFPKRLLQKVKEEPGIFEAVGIRLGKEVTLAKGTKKEVVSKFEKFLSGTLGASGFLKVGGKKIKAKETGLLKKAEYRVSKVDPFKIVERKEKRLKRGTKETQEIQFFKRKSKTKRKKK